MVLGESHEEKWNHPTSNSRGTDWLLHRIGRLFKHYHY